MLSRANSRVKLYWLSCTHVVCVGSKQIQPDGFRVVLSHYGRRSRSWFTMFLLGPCCSESVCAIKWYQENADADALSKLFTRVDKAQSSRMSQEGNSGVLNYIQKLWSNAISPLSLSFQWNCIVLFFCYERISMKVVDVTSFTIQFFTWVRITLLWWHRWTLMEWSLNDWRWWWNKFNFAASDRLTSERESYKKYFLNFLYLAILESLSAKEMKTFWLVSAILVPNEIPVPRAF